MEFCTESMDKDLLSTSKDFNKHGLFKFFKVQN